MLANLDQLLDAIVVEPLDRELKVALKTQALELTLPAIRLYDAPGRTTPRTRLNGEQRTIIPHLANELPRAIAAITRLKDACGLLLLVSLQP